MNKKIVIGSLMTIGMLMLLPSISSVECNTVIEVNKSNLLAKMQNMGIEEIKEKLLEDSFLSHFRIFGRIRLLLRLIILVILLKLLM